MTTKLEIKEAAKVISQQDDATDENAAERSIAALRKRLNHVLKGKPEVVEFVLTTLLANGHLLLEDKPGLGKTTLAKALAQAIGGKFSRVQCTPDLLPGDISGFSIYNEKIREFEFRSGPVFSDVLLADEINRATPRTQSALLEAMAERQVTVDGTCHALSSKFFVLATQNPIDQHGTYPLPEAQLDRFTMKLSIGYPAPEDELDMLSDAIENNQATAETDAIWTTDELEQIQQTVAKIHLDRRVQEYLIAVTTATRQHPKVSLGVSPRGNLIWQRAAQAWAFLQNRNFVIPDDLQVTALPVLGVRLGVDHGNAKPVIEEILNQVAVPSYTPPEKTHHSNTASANPSSQRKASDV